MKKIIIQLALCSLFLTQAACAEKKQSTCKKIRKKHGAEFNHTVCSIPNTKNSTYKVRLHWWNEEQKKPFYTLKNLKKFYNNNNDKLLFAMNAGMYDKQYAPLALHIENNNIYKPINLKNGAGNFHLMPNGVFWIDNSNIAHVTESHKFHEKFPTAKNVKFATQSGPMLVIDDSIHPKFKKNSDSIKMRNGVGICNTVQQDGSVILETKFIISDDWVNFYAFANLFKETYNCSNALFLDGGRASALYSNETKRMDTKYMGVMIGVSNR